jgi:hypothetical protein
MANGGAEEGEAMRTERRLGLVVLVAAAGGWIGWFAWRLDRAFEHPVPFALLVLEVAGAVGGLGAAVVLAGTPAGSPVTADRLDRYALTVVTACGSFDSVEHATMRSSSRALVAATDWRARVAALALLEGPRRAATVLVVAAALLLGASPIDEPPVVTLVLLVVAVVGTSIATWLLSARAVRPGDRLLGSYSSIGRTPGRPRDDDDDDHDDAALRAQWTGVVGSIVAVNVAISLRGVSDRWTHGLAPMTPDARVTAMVVGLVVVAGGFLCLAVLTPPAATSEETPRRLEERSARRTALGTTVAVGIVGLVAGILTGTVQADGQVERRVDGEVDRVETPAEGQTVVSTVDPHAAQVRDALVHRTEVATQGPDHP